MPRELMCFPANSMTRCFTFNLFVSSIAQRVTRRASTHRSSAGDLPVIDDDPRSRPAGRAGTWYVISLYAHPPRAFARNTTSARNDPSLGTECNFRADTVMSSNFRTCLWITASSSSPRLILLRYDPSLSSLLSSPSLSRTFRGRRNAELELILSMVKPIAR